MPDDSFGNRLKHAWSVFRNKEPTYVNPTTDIGPGYSTRPDLIRLTLGNERSIVSAVYNRISIDVSSVNLRHVRLDQNGRFISEINSGLNNCLSIEANIDQTGKAFIQDAVLSMFDEGVVALVPVDTTIDPAVSGAFDVQTLRTGRIIEWYPKHVRLSVYNENIGRRDEIVLPKKSVAIIENPLYAVMNEQNSTLKRLISKLNILDAIDIQSGSGKLDLIIQLPYLIKTEARKQQAEARRKDIETQLTGSKYGVAYTDATEKITQLNRPVENNLMKQIEYLTSMLYSQLGLTSAIFDGTADEKAMLNYFNRTVEPILTALTGGMNRTFITKTARSQGQSIEYFRDPFKLVPVSDLANIADSFTRNAILSSNEVRSIIGYKPSSDEDADKLSNKNLNPPNSSSIQQPMKEGSIITNGTEKGNA
jgi:hypothetical protein